MTEGCVENYEVAVMDRGGVYRVGMLKDLSSVRWSRRLSNVSTATIQIAGENCVDQIDLLQEIQPGRHELAIFRGAERVWEGPIDEASWTPIGVTITASDVFEYLNGTSLGRDWIYDRGPMATTNMLERVRWMIETELTGTLTWWNGGGQYITMQRWEELDPPVNLLPFLDVRQGDVVTRSRTLAFEMMLGEHIQNLARSTMSYTALGRSLIFWDSRQALSQTRRVVSNDFEGGLTVISSRKNLAVWSHAISSQEIPTSQGGGYVPRRSSWSPPEQPTGASNDYFGAWERIFSVEGEDAEEGDPSNVDYEALQDAARSDARGRYPVPLEINANDQNLIPTSDLPISDLVPGVLVPVSAIWNLRPVHQMMLLTGLTVEDDGSGETVRPSLMSAGPAEVM